MSLIVEIYGGIELHRTSDDGHSVSFRDGRVLMIVDGDGGALVDSIVESGVPQTRVNAVADAQLLPRDLRRLAKE